MNQTVTPPPESPETARVRVEGALDMVRISDQTFTLCLADGRGLPGRLVGRQITGLSRVLGRTLIVFGVGSFSPDGDLVGIDADGYIPNDGKLWTVAPEDLPLSPEVVEEQAQRTATGAGPAVEKNGHETVPAATASNHNPAGTAPPPPLPSVAEIVRRQQLKGGVSAVFGQWPGDETDEEIERGLKELS